MVGSAEIPGPRGLRVLSRPAYRRSRGVYERAHREGPGSRPLPSPGAAARSMSVRATRYSATRRLVVMSCSSRMSMAATFPSTCEEPGRLRACRWRASWRWATRRRSNAILEAVATARRPNRGTLHPEWRGSPLPKACRWKRPRTGAWTCPRPQGRAMSSATMDTCARAGVATAIDRRIRSALAFLPRRG